MGIKSLNKFLRDYCPEIFEEIHLSNFQFKKIAIDTSLYLCNYKALYGENGWLGAFIKLVTCLRENEIHCVFVYDSGYPPEKEKERKIRMEARKKLEKKVIDLEEAINKYFETKEIDPILVNFQNTKKLGRSLLNPKSININAIEYAVRKLRKQLFSITRRDFMLTKQLFNILNIPYLDAPMEAETLCSDLCKQGKVDAVLSEDTDVLAYGTHTFLTKIDTVNSTCIKIDYNKLLEKLEIDNKQFLDFCILCGTDYNKNIFRIGPNKAIKLIQNYENIDKLAEDIDVSILNHKRVRELFTDYKKSEDKVPYCGMPDFDKLGEFFIKKNININVDNIKKNFIREIIIEE